MSLLTRCYYSGYIDSTQKPKEKDNLHSQSPVTAKMNTNTTKDLYPLRSMLNDITSVHGLG